MRRSQRTHNDAPCPTCGRPPWLPDLTARVYEAAVVLDIGGYPPPADIAAEEDCVAGLAMGYVAPADLLPLAPGHFAQHDLADVACAVEAVVACGLPVRLKTIAAALHASGSAVRVTDLQRLDSVPAFAPRRYRLRARRVWVLAEMRALCRVLTEVDAQLRAAPALISDPEEAPIGIYTAQVARLASALDRHCRLVQWLLGQRWEAA